MATTLAELRDELLAAISASIAANNTPVEGKIRTLADVQNALAAGGGGGGGTVNAPTYFDYEVVTAHNSLTVGQIIRETIGANGASTWAFPGGGALPGGSPNRANLELLGFSGLSQQIETGFTAITGNQASMLALLGRNEPSTPLSATAAAGSAATLTIPATVNRANILTYIAAGYKGGSIPANTDASLSISWGTATTILPGIVTAGPAILFQNDSGMKGAVGSAVVLTLPPIPTLIPVISIGYRLGPVEVASPIRYTSITYSRSAPYSAEPNQDATYQNLNDGNRITGTVTQYSALSSWITADLGSDVTIGRIGVGGGSITGWGAVAAFLNNAVIETATDASPNTWQSRGTVSGVVDTVGSEISYFSFTPVSARYVRISLPTNYISTTEFSVWSS